VTPETVNVYMCLQTCRASPFVRYQPHRCSPGIVPATADEGILDVPNTSPLFTFCEAMVATGGSFIQGVANRVAWYRLCSVQAVTHTHGRYLGYEDELRRCGNNRKTGMQFFNYAIRELEKNQLHVLDALRNHFQDRPPGTDSRSANTFYSFHGCRCEHVENICSNGIVATRATDAGYFGSGCYSTLIMEYAARYAYGEFDDPPVARPSRNGRYPVIMFACFVSMAYPVTPLDYGHEPIMKPGHSDYFARPLKTGFDCHVVCVNEASGFQAVERPECQYVEIVIEQQCRMLPVAVLWFDRI
jgi:hypothetical protein